MSKPVPVAQGDRVDLRELHAQREEATQRLEDAMAKAEALQSKLANGSATADDERSLADLDATVVEATDEVDRLNRLIASEATRMRAAGVVRTARGLVPTGEAVTDEPHPVAAGGFKSLAHFAHEARRSTVAHPSEAMGSYIANVGAAIGDAVTTDGDAGFLVPPQYASEVWRPAFPGDVDLVDLIPAMSTSQNQLVMPTYEGMPWGTSAVKAYFRDSATTAMTESRPNFRGLTVDNHEVHAVCSLDSNLGDDAPFLESMLRQEMNRAVRYTVSSRFYAGTGAGEPAGYKTAAATVKVARKTASQVNADDLLKAMSRIIGFSQAFWVMHPSVLPALGVMTVGDMPVWLPNGSVTGVPTGTILGRPVYFLEHAELLGTEADVALVNPSGYLRTQRTGGATGYAVSPHVYFLYNANTIRLTARVGGKPKLSAAIKSRPDAKAGTTNHTYSHFVVLTDASGG